jgi:hypothetical protein
MEIFHQTVTNKLYQPQPGTATGSAYEPRTFSRSPKRLTCRPNKINKRRLSTKAVKEILQISLTNTNSNAKRWN